ncbi:hypothetical protein CDAR_407311 [Caerostris darwini]|uniref:Uncharacterized protein n=1 Tax=Caerostris darwini TaxID=1538125 RepID=A0AAV4Q3B4_9ARAC|nr:hypothetical protein CDAR_407311 [Caerostris darwini]
MFAESTEQTIGMSCAREGAAVERQPGTREPAAVRSTCGGRPVWGIPRMFSAIGLFTCVVLIETRGHVVIEPKRAKFHFQGGNTVMFTDLKYIRLFIFYNQRR